MNQERMGHGLAKINGLIFAVGGFTMGVNYSAYQELNTVEFFDPSEESWTYVCSMSFPRHHVATASLDGSMYAVGGLCCKPGGEHSGKI